MSTITRPPGRVRFSVEEFARMRDAGLFEGRHVELLDGELYEVTKNPPHNYAVDVLARALRLLLEGIGYLVREEKSIGPWEDWWPEPDIAVVRGPKERYKRQYPIPADIVLLVEVCDTSPQDRTKKLAGYAAAGIATYWIVDLNERRLEVYTQPVAGAYPAPAILGESEAVELVIDGQVVGQLAVADLLP